MCINEHIVIVGAGPAGCAAAIQCTRLGVPPLVLDRTGQVGGLISNAFLVENYPGLEPMRGTEFADRLTQHFARFGIPITRGVVTALARTSHQLSALSQEGITVCGDFGKIHATSVIVAVGTESVRLDVPGAAELEGNGLFYEVRHFLEFHSRLGQTVVIGGGEAAFDYALSLARADAKVILLVRAPSPRAHGRLVEMVNREPAIKVVLHTRPRAIRANPANCAGFVIETSGPNGSSTLQADGILVAIGRRSTAPSLLPGLEADPRNPIMTRDPGIFVVGDARAGSLGQLAIAVGDGLQAAEAAVRHVRENPAVRR